jgi:hydrogenase expression/formation protein HypC
LSNSHDLGQVGRILQIQDTLARVDLGGGTTIQANIAFAEAKVGDFVLVHARYVLKVLDTEESERMLSRWR